MNAIFGLLLKEHLSLRQKSGHNGCCCCGDNCDAGLTFDTNLTYINGEANMFVNFNSDVNINGDLYNTFVI